MSDITELRPRGDARTRQFRAERELASFVASDEVLGTVDPSILWPTGINVFMRKSWLMHDVIKFDFAGWSYKNLRANES